MQGTIGWPIVDHSSLGASLFLFKVANIEMRAVFNSNFNTDAHRAI